MKTPHIPDFMPVVGIFELLYSQTKIIPKMFFPPKTKRVLKWENS